MLSPDSNPKLAGKIPADILTSLQVKLGQLEQSLLKQDPEMKNHLRESHALLITYPETAHLLDDQEIANLVKAAEVWTNTYVVSEAAKGKGTSRKGKKEIDAANDL